MANFITGIILTTCFFLLFSFTKKNNIKLKWWQWIVTLLLFVFIAFVILMTYSFIIEGATKAAVVMGSIFGFICVLGAVLVKRLFFATK